MAGKRGFGIGLQWFPDFIKREAVYVDKTAYVYQMAHEKGKYFFLSRPRRFGKSLLVSTMQAYFEGRKELFRGLAVDGLEKEPSQGTGAVSEICVPYWYLQIFPVVCV